MLNIELIRNELLGKSFVSEVIYFDTIGSTNSFAKNRGVKDGTIVLTDFQTSGRGRYERIWESEKGSNLTFTVKKRFDIRTSDFPFVNFFFSLCVYETLREFLEQEDIPVSPLNIKWPNDILYGSEKICGLLVESNLAGKEFIIGIGINVNQLNFSSEFSAASLAKISGKETDLTCLLLKLIKKIDSNMARLVNADESLFEDWRKATNLIGKAVVFNSSDQTNKYGNVIGLQRDGGIMLLVNNTEQVFYSGDIKITLIGN